MKRSTERMLTTHTGSFARPSPDLVPLLLAKESGQAYDQEAFATRVRAAVVEVVRPQVEFRVNIVSDGEQSMSGFYQYAKERLSGFEFKSLRSGERPLSPSWADEHAERVKK